MLLLIPLGQKFGGYFDQWAIPVPWLYIFVATGSDWLWHLYRLLLTSLARFPAGFPARVLALAFFDFGLVK